MKVYATPEDLIDRYGEMTEDEQKRAEILLTDASAIILAAGGLKEPKEADDAAYRAVCCAMVHRVMISPSWLALGVTQRSQTSGPFTESMSFNNPNGDLYLTKAERKTLGLGGSVIGSIAPANMPERQPEA